MNETRNKRPIQFSIFGVARWLPVIGRTVGWYDVRHVWAPANKEIENRRRLSVGFDWKIPFCWAAGSLDEFVRAFQVDSHADDNAPAGCYYIKLVSVSACQNRQMSVTGGCRRELPRSPLTCSPPLLITSPMNKSTKLKTRPVCLQLIAVLPAKRWQNVKKCVKVEASLDQRVISGQWSDILVCGQGKVKERSGPTATGGGCHSLHLWRGLLLFPFCSQMQQGRNCLCWGLHHLLLTRPIDWHSNYPLLNFRTAQKKMFLNFCKKQNSISCCFRIDLCAENVLLAAANKVALLFSYLK